jgi:hypothetical protein
MSITPDELTRTVEESLDTLDRTVALLTPARGGDVSCSEGEVVEAEAGQGVDFGGVTSCMTVTCILSDGAKIAGHAWQFGYDHILSGISARISGRTVDRVIVAGVSGAWTPDFENQATMITRYKKAHDIPEDAELMAHMGWSGAEGYERLSAALAPLSAAADLSTFKGTISGALGGTVSFTDSSAGTIRVRSDGTLA